MVAACFASPELFKARRFSVEDPQAEIAPNSKIAASRDENWNWTNAVPVMVSPKFFPVSGSDDSPAKFRTIEKIFDFI